MKRAERSTDRNPPPIFTKLATKVESREVLSWLPIVLVEIRKTHDRQTVSGINFHNCSYGNENLHENLYSPEIHPVANNMREYREKLN